MPKAAKIAIIVVGLTVGLGALAWFTFGSSNPSLPNGQLLVHVVTGQTKTMDRDDIRMLPAPDENGDRLWFPAYRENGTVRVIDRYQDFLVEKLGERKDLRVDLSTFELIP